MEILHPLTGQKALTLVDQLPSTLQEWPVMVNLLERAFKGTVKDGSKKSDSIGTAFKWVAVALGLADSNLDEDRQWNLRKYVEELQSNAIDIAHCHGRRGRQRADPHHQPPPRAPGRQRRCDRGRAHRRGGGHAPLQAAQGLARAAPRATSTRTWSEFARTNDSRKVCVCARKECVLAPLAQLFLRN